jgi:hypothetical protein
MSLFVIVWIAASCMTVNLDNRSVSTPVATPTAMSEALVTATPVAATSTATPIAAMVTPTPVAPSPTATAQPTATSTSVPPTATSRAMNISQPRRPTATPTAQPPIIFSFVADRLEIDPGESVTLSWSTSHDVQSAVIHQQVPDDRYPEDVYIAPNGNLTLTTDDNERLWYKYTLTVFNNTGGSTQSSLVVNLRCPYTYFFAPIPAEDQEQWNCPGGPAIFSPAAEQVFEGGRMIWLKATQTVYVFLNDGTLLFFPDTWSTGQPESDPQIVAPQSRYQPIRGFGKVWRTATYYNANRMSVREQLGWALAPEKAFDGALQNSWLRCCARFYTVYRPTYLRSADGRVLRLWGNEFPAGMWKYATP